MHTDAHGAEEERVKRKEKRLEARGCKDATRVGLHASPAAAVEAWHPAKRTQRRRRELATDAHGCARSGRGKSEEKREKGRGARVQGRDARRFACFPRCGGGSMA